MKDRRKKGDAPHHLFLFFNYIDQRPPVAASAIRIVAAIDELHFYRAAGPKRFEQNTAAGNAFSDQVFGAGFGTPVTQLLIVIHRSFTIGIT